MNPRSFTDPGLPDPHAAKAVLAELARPFLRAAPAGTKPPAAPARRPPGDVATFGPIAALFGSLPDVLPDPLIVVNEDGLIVLANRHTARVFGYAREELLGAPVELLIPARYHAEHVKRRQGYFREGPRPRPMGAAQNLHGRPKDGGEFPVEVSLSPLPTESGLVVVSTVRDISERVRLEKRYRTLVEGIPAVTFMAPLDAGVGELYVSPQIEQLLGFTQQEWLADPILWYRQLHPDDKERWHTEFAQTCNAGKPFRAEYRFKSRDGKDVWVLGQAKVVTSDERSLNPTTRQEPIRAGRKAAARR